MVLLRDVTFMIFFEAKVNCLDHVGKQKVQFLDIFDVLYGDEAISKRDTYKELCFKRFFLCKLKEYVEFFENNTTAMSALKQIETLLKVLQDVKKVVTSLKDKKRICCVLQKFYTRNI